MDNRNTGWRPDDYSMRRTAGQTFQGQEAQGTRQAGAPSVPGRQLGRMMPRISEASVHKIIANSGEIPKKREMPPMAEKEISKHIWPTEMMRQFQNVAAQEERKPPAATHSTNGMNPPQNARNRGAKEAKSTTAYYTSGINPSVPVQGRREPEPPANAQRAGNIPPAAAHRMKESNPSTTTHHTSSTILSTPVCDSKDARQPVTVYYTSAATPPQQPHMKEPEPACMQPSTSIFECSEPEPPITVYYTTGSHPTAPACAEHEVRPPAGVHLTMERVADTACEAEVKIEVQQKEKVKEIAEVTIDRRGFGPSSKQYVVQMQEFIDKELHMFQIFSVFAKRYAAHNTHLNTCAEKCMHCARRISAAQFLITGSVRPISVPHTEVGPNLAGELRRQFHHAQDMEDAYRAAAAAGANDRCLHALYHAMADAKAELMNDILLLVDVCHQN